MMERSLDLHNPLEALIRDEISRNGPVTFARFMALALYHPALGYYSGGGEGREPVGWRGDFFTSGDVHPLWGWCFARQLHQMWELLGRPQPFHVLEPGAGRGLLARDVWAYAVGQAPEWAAALHYTLIERAPEEPSLRSRREAWLSERLAELGTPAGATRWVGTLEDAGAAHEAGCVVANELVDALPVHVVEARDGELAEVFVDAAPGRLVERPGPPSTPELERYLDHYGIPWRRYPNGWRAEICLEAAQWMRGAAGALARGFVMVIDYGEVARRLYTPERRRGTLAAYAHHQIGERPLAQPGRQDLTAHVNFSAPIEAGRAAGLHSVGLTPQRNFLLRLGIREEEERLAAQLFPHADSERHTDRGQADYLRRAILRSAVETLLDPRGLGKFLVLVMHREAPGASKRLLGMSHAAP